MNLPQQDQIEAYLFNLLTDTEKAVFEAELSKNISLRKQLKRVRLEHQAIQLLEEERIKKQFGHWKEEKHITDKKEATIVAMPRNRMRKNLSRFSAAASIILILVAAAFGWGNTHYTNQKLANAAFDYTSTSRSMDATTTSFFENAQRAYQEKKYVAAENSYQQIIQQNTDKAVIQLAEWNLATTFLAMGATEKTKQLLTKIAQNNNHIYQENATLLLEQLNSPWRFFRNK